MSAPSPTTPDTEFEPFGQTGVRQYIFPVLTVLSLTCMVLSLGMWVRSHFIVDTFETERGGVQLYVSSIYGRVLCAWGDNPRQPAPRDEWLYRQSPIPEQIRDMWQPSIWKHLGFEARTGDPLPSRFLGTSGGWLRVRWPLIVAMWGILPVLRIVREHRRKRAADRILHGRCPRCGYDVRATPHACPECGLTLVEVRV